MGLFMDTGSFLPCDDLCPWLQSSRMLCQRIPWSLAAPASLLHPVKHFNKTTQTSNTWLLGDATQSSHRCTSFSFSFLTVTAGSALQEQLLFLVRYKTQMVSVYL